MFLPQKGGELWLVGMKAGLQTASCTTKTQQFIVYRDYSLMTRNRNITFRLIDPPESP